LAAVAYIENRIYSAFSWRRSLARRDFGVDEAPYAQFHAYAACGGCSGCLISEADESYLAAASSEVTLVNIDLDRLYLPLLVR
jgi:hypothetical protein